MRLRRPIPRKWARRVFPLTVCIAATADDHEAIVACVDTRISTAVTSLDPTVGRKMCGFRGWTILSSGTLAYAETLVDSFQGLLGQAQDNEPATVQRCLEDALRIELPKFSAARYLTPYGLDMPTFLRARQTGFSDERWNELSRLMWDYSESYDVELIVCGWGDRQTRPSDPSIEKAACASGHIFSANRDGVVAHGDVGFYCCGSGGPAAHSMLSFFNHEPHIRLAETVFHVAAAKFMSERTAGVGCNTLMRVLKRVGEDEWGGYFIQPGEIDEIRKVWEEKGSPRLPVEAEDVIVSILGKHQKSMNVSNGHIMRMVERIKKQKES